jgi:hypothetical protein
MAKQIGLSVLAVYEEQYQLQRPTPEQITAEGEEWDAEDPNGSIELFLTDHAADIIRDQDIKPFARELSEQELEDIEWTLPKGSTSRRATLPPLAPRLDESALVTVTLRTTYSAEFAIAKPTRADLIDGGGEWEPGCGDDNIQEYVEDNLEEMLEQAPLLAVEFDEAEFLDLSFDLPGEAVSEFFIKLTVTRLDGTRREGWLDWDVIEFLGDQPGERPYIHRLALSKVKAKRRIEEMERSNAIDRAMAERRAERDGQVLPAWSALTYELVPATGDRVIELTTAT